VQLIPEHSHDVWLWCPALEPLSNSLSGPFALHRQQLENYKQNVDVTPPRKISADAHDYNDTLYTNE